MKPIEYDCDGVASIRWEPEFISVIGNKPGYWYIKMSLRPWHDMSLWKAGFKTFYWNGNCWHIATPKQYATAEAAFADWKTVVPHIKG